MAEKTVKLASPYGYLKHHIKNKTEGEIIAWDRTSGKPLIRFQLEETQVIVAVPIHWLVPVISEYTVVDRMGLPEI